MLPLLPSPIFLYPVSLTYSFFCQPHMFLLLLASHVYSHANLTYPPPLVSLICFLSCQSHTFPLLTASHVSSPVNLTCSVSFETHMFPLLVSSCLPHSSPSGQPHIFGLMSTSYVPPLSASHVSHLSASNVPSPVSYVGGTMSLNSAYSIIQYPPFLLSFLRGSVKSSISSSIQKGKSNSNIWSFYIQYIYLYEIHTLW
jgi:hypothetical protein